MNIFDIFDVKIVFYGQKYVYWSNLSHIEYLLVNIFKKIRKRTKITKNATTSLISDKYYYVTQYLAVYTNFLSKSSLYIKKSSQDRILFNSESFSRKIDFLIFDYFLPNFSPKITENLMFDVKFVTSIKF